MIILAAKINYVLFVNMCTGALNVGNSASLVLALAATLGCWSFSTEHSKPVLHFGKSLIFFL